jgi:hypothetical protein
LPKINCSFRNRELQHQHELSEIIKEENHDLSFELLTITSEKQRLAEELEQLKMGVTDDSSESIVPLRTLMLDLEQFKDEKISRLVIDLCKFNSNEE